MVNKQFLLAGSATFTIEHPAIGDRPAGWYTYRVQYEPATERWSAAWFVQMLTGPDNQRDYRRLGKLDDFTGHVKPVRGACCREDSFPFRLLNRVLCRIWGGEQEVIEAAGYRVHHEGCCGRCGHPLTTPLSVETGIGPECAKILGIERTRTAPQAKQPEPAETYEASDRDPELADVEELQPIYDKEGELVWWNGKRNGKPVRIFND